MKTTKLTGTFIEPKELTNDREETDSTAGNIQEDEDNPSYTEKDWEITMRNYQD